MADNKYYFKELEIKQQFESDVEEIFANEDVYNELGAEVYVIGKKKKDATTFPCIYVDIEESNADMTYASTTAIQQFTNFTLTFDIYSKELENFTQDDAVIKISEILINGIQHKYRNLVVVLNRGLPNLDETVSRKQVRFDGTIDNSDNYIYYN